jgi:hypothetical protein
MQPAAMTAIFAIDRSERDSVALTKRLASMIAISGATVIVCDVRPLSIDLATVELLARLEREASRHGARLRLHHVPDPLGDLVALVGLGDVLFG